MWQKVPVTGQATGGRGRVSGTRAEAHLRAAWSTSGPPFSHSPWFREERNSDLSRKLPYIPNLVEGGVGLKSKSRVWSNTSNSKVQRQRGLGPPNWWGAGDGDSGPRVLACGWPGPWS